MFKGVSVQLSLRYIRKKFRNQIQSPIKKTSRTRNLGIILSSWSSRRIWKIYLLRKNVKIFLKCEYNIDYSKLSNHLNVCMEVMCTWGIMEMNYEILASVIILQMLCWPLFADIIATFCLNIYLNLRQSSISDGINFNFWDATFFPIPTGSFKQKTQHNFFSHIFIFIDC